MPGDDGATRVDTTRLSTAGRARGAWRWLSTLRQRLGRSRDERASPLVGYAGVWFTRDQLHLVTIAVDPAVQRRGVAAHLLLRCVELALEAAMGSIALEVRPGNDAARALYARFGFREVGRLRAYYPDNGDDALVMLSPPLDDTEFVARLDELRAKLSERGVDRSGVRLAHGLSTPRAR